ncbi:phage baseplate assembly protein V [Guyparkeria sp. SB14A]|nr:phage baseplate assembly protein V [Guyparkeria sp. SB14A]
MAPLRRRLRVLFTRGVVRLIDPGTLMQSLQVEGLAGELMSGVEHFEAYGLTAHPHPGAEALLAALGGDRSHTVAVTVADRRYRLTNLAPGEVALYDDRGNKVHLMRDKVKVTAVDHLEATAPTTLITSEVTIDGNLKVKGDITDRYATTGTTLNHVREVYNGHDHDENDGGSTSSPNQSM